MIVSTSRSLPSAVTIERSRTSAIAVRHELGVRLCQRRVPVVAEEDPLAADREPRPQALAQRRVGHLALEMPRARRLGEPHQARVHEREHEALRREVDAPRAQRLRARRASGTAASRRALIARPPRGITHGAVRWKTWMRPASGWISGTNWIADAPVPMTAIRSPLRSWSWSHRAEWNAAPRKRSIPGSCGVDRVGEQPAARDQDVGRERARGRLDPPALAVPRGARHVMAVADVRVTPRSLRDAAQVVPDLLLAAERLRPVRVRRERERVEARGHVAAAARVGVVAPGAAEVVGALEQDEVLDPGLAQPYAEADAGEPGPDDRDAVVLGRSAAVKARAAAAWASGRRRPTTAR